MGKKSGARRHRHAKELEDKVAEEMGTKKVQIDTVMESESDTDSDDGEQTKLTPDSKWQNRTRVLMMCSRGTIFRTRYLMKNLKNIMPHGKSESKFSKNEKFSVINEIAELQNCSKVMFFENRKHKDTYLWLADASNGPSVKFLVHNIHTMEELKMVGNCLKGSRPILSFDDTFDTQPHFQLIKELLKSVSLFFY